jgi:hypothetical protein
VGFLPVHTGFYLVPQQFGTESNNPAWNARPLLAAIGLAVVMWLAWYSLGDRTGSARVLTIKQVPAGAVEQGKTTQPLVALDYATAVRDGDCDTVIRLTDWMQTRLSYVASKDPSSAATIREQERLCAELSDRRVEGNQMQRQGVEDNYVFAPGSEIVVVRTDSGLASLGTKVKERIWLKVTYPATSMALRDESASPIRSLVAGVNVSVDNTVLKAGIIGNLEIDENSIDTRWVVPPGE